MKATELRDLLRGVRQLFNAQESTLKKYEQKIWSPALDKMNRYYESSEKKAPSRMNINQMRGELFHLQDFFQAETSTIPGARRVQNEQDIRFFGKNSKGKPKKRLTTDQRTQLWSIFDEYKKMRPADVLENSTIVQQALASMLIEKGELDFSAKTLDDLAVKIYEMRQQVDWEMGEEYDDDESVFSGTRPY